MKYPIQFGRFFNLPASLWILLGLALSYLLFFAVPVFLTTNSMQFFRYVPAAEHIGIDLKQTLSFSAYWLGAGSIPYVSSNSYPPLASFLFVPLLGLKFSMTYKVITILTLLSYGFLTLGLPFWTIGKYKSFSLPAIFGAAGLMSYTFHFELERGQFDVIAILPAMLAVWIFHTQPRRRWLAYLLFCLSVQLKLYPLIVVLMLVEDWRDVWSNIRRIFILIFANVALFLAFGLQIFSEFARSTQDATLNPHIWIGNHSVRSAATLGFQYAERHGFTGLERYIGITQIFILLFVLACLVLTMLEAYKKGRTGLNPYLLVVCVIVALLVPPVSHDYRLTILGFPIAILFIAEVTRSKPVGSWVGVLRMLILLVVAFAYSSTFYSYSQKPYFLANNFPALLGMLIGVTVLAWFAPLAADRAK